MPIAEPMQVAILLLSTGTVDTLSGTVAAIKKMDDAKATLDYVSGLLIEEQRSQNITEISERDETKIQAAVAPQAGKYEMF